MLSLMYRHSAETRRKMSAKRREFVKNNPNFQTGEKNPSWKGGIRYHEGYRMLYKPEHPRSQKSGYIPEHVYLIEIHLGRALKPAEHVHHINGQRVDNRIENLVVLTQSQHMRLHRSNSPRDKRGRWRKS